MKAVKFLLAAVFSTSILNGWATDPDYSVSKIPAELLKNANAVKRYEELKFEVVNVGKAKLYKRIAITVLNENGDRYVNYQQDYDKLHTVESIEGRLFDENGKLIRSLKKSEVQDVSGTSEISLAEDNRVKLFSFYHKLYPYTVEYVTELKYNYTLFYPSWIPQEDEYYSVQYSTVSVSCPADMNFRYKSFNYAGQPVVTNDKTNRITTWEVKNVAAIEDEYASPYWFEKTPVVFMAPVQFSVENYQGDMSSWQDFGKFVYALKNGRDQLPDNIKQTVHSLTDGIPDTRRKIELLYDFLQKNTRYVSIQLGIGGWQPYDAKYVAANRFGDCKALSNYMYSLLKEAGIRSLYTLVHAGDYKTFFMSDFPSSQFNHVILCVPLQKDTMWLECTSQTVNAGYLGAFTCDRSVLVIDENGGTLVRTPRYAYHQNLQLRRTIASIDDEGNLNAEFITDYQAVQQDDLHDLINGLSKQKVMDYLREEINLPTYDVVKFDYKQEKKLLPLIREDLTVTATNYAQVTGTRLFVSPNILSKWQRKLPDNETRKFDVEIKSEFKDVDTVEIKVPAGYQPEAVPQAFNLDTRFGKYSLSVNVAGDKIVYFRTMEQYKGRYPPASYGELVKFYDQIYKNDRSKVVLVKK